jgi:uncharacterized protein YjbJ (UPF0337 family)
MPHGTARAQTVGKRTSLPIGKQWRICDAPSSPSFAAIAGNIPIAETFSWYRIQEREMVDKDRVKGSAEQAKGKAKEWAGKAAGDAKTESEGKADQAKGKVQNTVGGLKDAVREK